MVASQFNSRKRGLLIQVDMIMNSNEMPSFIYGWMIIIHIDGMLRMMLNMVSGYEY